MADTNYPPPYAGLTFGADNNLAKDISTRWGGGNTTWNWKTDWSEWVEAGDTETVNKTLILHDYLLKETIPAGSKLYFSLDFQLKDVVLGELIDSNNYFSFQGVDAQNASYSKYTSINGWGTYNTVLSPTDGYHRLISVATTEKEGNLTTAMFRFDYMKCSIRYRRFRLVKM